MECNVLEATDYAGWHGTPESPRAVPPCLEPAMLDLVEQGNLIEAYRTGIHQTVTCTIGTE